MKGPAPPAPASRAERGAGGAAARLTRLWAGVVAASNSPPRFAALASADLESDAAEIASKPPGCTGAPVAFVGARLDSGSVLCWVEDPRPWGSLGAFFAVVSSEFPEARFFAVGLAGVAEVTDPADLGQVASALAAADGRARE